MLKRNLTYVAYALRIHMLCCELFTLFLHNVATPAEPAATACGIGLAELRVRQLAAAAPKGASLYD